jgi:hypothetical protein
VFQGVYARKPEGETDDDTEVRPRLPVAASSTLLAGSDLQSAWSPSIERVLDGMGGDADALDGFVREAGSSPADVERAVAYRDQHWSHGAAS